jgi:hypothetical protein
VAEQIQLAPGSALMAGPQTACEGSGGFPASVVNTPLALNPSCKAYAVSTGPQLANVNSPSAPFALPGVSSGGPVTQAHTLYFRVATPMLLSLTFLGGTAQVLPVFGLAILEFSPTAPLVAMAVQGSGQVEYLGVGNQ